MFDWKKKKKKKEIKRKGELKDVRGKSQDLPKRRSVAAVGDFSVEPDSGRNVTKYW